MTMPMYKTAAVAAVLAILGAGQPGLADEPNVRRQSESLSVPADRVTYKDLGGPQLGAVWGDSARGPHGSFLRLPQGFVSPVHRHTGAYYGVVVEGTVTNAETGQPAPELRPGSYYLQKGNTDHVTKCLGTTGCLIFISQSTAFDFITTKK
jgi:hypothetical protein